MAARRRPSRTLLRESDAGLWKSSIAVEALASLYGRSGHRATVVVHDIGGSIVGRSVSEVRSEARDPSPVVTINQNLRVGVHLVATTESVADGKQRVTFQFRGRREVSVVGYRELFAERFDELVNTACDPNNPSGEVQLGPGKARPGIWKHPWVVGTGGSLLAAGIVALANHAWG
jgi:hypothetical protein